MPLHEYECDVCGRRFEKIQKFSDPPIEVCPTCGGHVHKLISSPAFQFKGSGFYATDYAKKEAVSGGKTGGESKDGAPPTKDQDTAGSGKAEGEKKSEASSSAAAPDSKPAKDPS
jgi:putative FmdB family regulatory protein